MLYHYRTKEQASTGHSVRTKCPRIEQRVSIFKTLRRQPYDTYARIAHRPCRPARDKPVWQSGGKSLSYAHKPNRHAMSAENAVQQYIRENGQRFVEELSELLRIPSISAESAHAPDMLRGVAVRCTASLGSRPGRSDVHRRQSGRLCRKNGRPGSPDRTRIRSLRCHARRSCR